MKLKEKRQALDAHIENTKKYHAQLETKVEEGEESSGEERAKLQSMIDDGKRLREEYEQAKEIQELDDYVNEPQPRRSKQGGARVAHPKSWGEIVVASPQFHAAKNSREPKMARVNVKDLYGSDVSAGGALVIPHRDPNMVGLPQRPHSVIDLVSVMQTSSDTVQIVIHAGRIVAAAVVPERVGAGYGPKPKGSLDFALMDVPVKTIAQWIPASRRILMDAPQLRDLVDVELTDILRITLEDQILAGDGTGNNFTGILETAGILTRTQGSTTDRAGKAEDTKADVLRRALTDIRLQFYEANGILLHPTEGEELELLKDDNKQYLKIYDGVSGQIWRTAVVESPVIPESTGLVGNYQMGATLYDRMETEIRVGEPNNFFLENAVAILAELRAAFAVKRPACFERVTFA